MQERISRAEIGSGHVIVGWDGAGETARFPFFWLRDHDHSTESLHPQTKQRQVDTFAIPTDIAPERVAVEDEGATLRIAWRGNGSQSVYPAAFLKQVAAAQRAQRGPRYELWDASIADRLPAMQHEEVVGSEDGLRRWLELVERFGFALVHGVPVSAEATQKFAERISYIRQTIFGGFWELAANMKHDDTAYTTQALGPHTDGTYTLDPPGYQMFHCLRVGGTGGESTLVDGFKIADVIRTEDPEAYAVLTRVRVPAQYIGDGVHLCAEHPVIGLDEEGHYRQIAYNNTDRRPFLLPEGEMSAFYHALAQFNRLATDPALELVYLLRPGTILLFDNWRALHGRRAFTGGRHLCGAYLNKEDVESRLRVLRAG